MAYFFILPGFVLYVVAMCLALAGTFLYQPAASLRSHVLSVLIWSSLGFVASTIAYAVLTVLVMLVMERAPAGGIAASMSGVAMVGMVFIAPFIAAALGLVGGAVVGLRRSLAKARRVG
jgi:hypothetical protein